MIVKDDIKLKLISLVEKSVISSLIANKYVIHTGKELTWNNITITDETLELLEIIDSKSKNIDENNINVEKLLDELMEIFPSHQLDSKKALFQRWLLFQKKTDIKDLTYEEIIEAAKNHVERFGPKYCGNLFYFFFKEDKKIYTSRLEKAVLEIRKSEKYNNDIDASVTLK